MMALSKHDILASKDFNVELLNVPEWGGNVHVRTMTGKERNDLVDWRNKQGDDCTSEFQRRFCALVLCDEKGQRLFTDDEAGELGEKSAKALDRVMAAAMRLNGMSDDAMQELEKNSETAGSAGSGSS